MKTATFYECVSIQSQKRLSMQKAYSKKGYKCMTKIIVDGDVELGKKKLRVV